MADPSKTNQTIIQLITAFNNALNARDIDTMMSLLAEDCVFENTYPPPDGTRYTGKKSVRKFWEDFFNGSQSARIEIEDIFTTDDRCLMLWTYYWTDLAGDRGHIRGVDIYIVTNGLIKEKLSYVKG